MRGLLEGTKRFGWAGPSNRFLWRASGRIRSALVRRSP